MIIGKTVASSTNSTGKGLAMARVVIDHGGVAALRSRGIDKGSELAHDIARDAHFRAPRDTGTLAASIHVEGAGPSWSIVADPRHPRDGRSYAKFPEFGTRFMAAQPYLRPAAYTWRG